VNRPLAISDEEFTRRLWAETDASLRRDPERWVTAYASGGSTGYVEERQSGMRAYARDARQVRAAHEHATADERYDL
jgi:hypothetical protein